MTRYIINRLLGLVAVLIGVSVLAFVFSNISDVDSAEAYAMRNLVSPTPEQIEKLREEMELNLPVHEQYFNWASESLQGNLGNSLITKNTVLEDIKEKMPITLSVAGMSFFWIVLLTIP